MNALLLNISFGLKRFKQFRKHVPVDFKRGDKHAHRNPHAMPLQVKQQLLKVLPIQLRSKKEEIGRPSAKWKGNLSHPTADLPNTVCLSPSRLHFPAR